MTLAADFTDRLACPRCGSPVRRIGRWYTSSGEWVFAAEPISAKRPRSERPEYDGQRWTDYPRTVQYDDKRTGLTMSKRQSEWHYIVDFECVGTVNGIEGACGLLWQRADCKPYTGETHDWMLVPEKPSYNKERIAAIKGWQR